MNYKSTERLKGLFIYCSDFICLMIVYWTTGLLWLYWYKEIELNQVYNMLYGDLFTILSAFVIVKILFPGDDDFNSDSKFCNVINSGKQNIILGGMIAVIELLNHSVNFFPRGVYILLLLGNFVLQCIERKVIKRYVIKLLFKTIRQKLLVISTKDRAESAITNLKNNTKNIQDVMGLAIIDEDLIGQEIGGIPVVANVHTMITCIMNKVVDSVYIDVDEAHGNGLHGLIMQLEDMGVVVNMRLTTLDAYGDFAIAYGSFGKVPVVTFANKFYRGRDMFFKRCIDIVGAIVGLLITLIVSIFIAPAIKIESKGPVFFKQKRVGRNGRYFYIYKFRSMYIDAEERKKELMSQNEMNGLMFKMSDDPRITKVGKFIRKTSIDELPQFFNVFKGDMSLVGTRPPTAAEFKQYKGHHRRRLSMKPGITGMWQAYGRNSVSDFEKIVQMDLDYIDNWSILLDIKILFRTAYTVLLEGGK